MRLEKILRNKAVKNAGWLIGGKLMNKVLAFVVSLLSARYLGPGNFGLINYAATYTTFFASLCNLGINSIIIKNFSDHPEESGETIGTTLVLRALSSLLSAVMIVGVVSIVDRDEPLTILVVALSSLGLLFQIFDTYNYWFHWRLQSKYAAIATVISYIAVSGYKILMLATGKSVVWFALATSVDYVVLAVFLLLAYRKNGGQRLSFSLKKGKQLLAASSSFIISGLMVSIYAGTDKLMLKHMLDEATVGHYGVAVTLSTMWAFVIQAVIDSMIPGIIEFRSKNAELYRKKNRRLYALVFYFAAAVSLCISILAKPLVLILYGQQYAPAIAPLRIVVWYTAFAYLGVARNAWIVCENRQKYLKHLYIAAAVINVVLNWVLIPRWGATGAATASLLTQISTTIFLPAIIRPLQPNVKLMAEAILLRKIK